MSKVKCCDLCEGMDGFCTTPNCKCHTEKAVRAIPEWEKEFDDRFGVILDDVIPFSEQYSADDHKTFIRELLTTREAEVKVSTLKPVLSVIEGLKYKYGKEVDVVLTALVHDLEQRLTTNPKETSV